MAVMYTYNGKEQTVAEIAKQVGMSTGGLHKRIKKCDYNIDEALNLVNTQKAIQMVGNKYNRLTVVAELDRNNHNQRVFKCECECGNEVTAIGSDLRYNHTMSCGCYNSDRLTKHGMAGTSVYKIWSAIHQRCTNKDNSNYHNYGGRGITICDEWLKFEGFYKDMGEANGLTIDRIDNNKGYSKDNCRWATRKEQANNLRSNVLITYKGETKTVGEWADITGMNIDTLRRRVYDGWGADRVIEEPVGTPKTQRKFTKAVIQYDKEMNMVKEYSSITEASNAVGCSNTGIGYVVNGKRATAGGFIWKYKEVV